MSILSKELIEDLHKYVLKTNFIVQKIDQLDDLEEAELYINHLKKRKVEIQINNKDAELEKIKWYFGFGEKMTDEEICNLKVGDKFWKVIEESRRQYPPYLAGTFSLLEVKRISNNDDLIEYVCRTLQIDDLNFRHWIYLTTEGIVQWIRHDLTAKTTTELVPYTHTYMQDDFMASLYGACLYKN